MSLHWHNSLKSCSLLSSACLDELNLHSCLPNVSGYLETQHIHTALDIYVIDTHFFFNVLHYSGNKNLSKYKNKHFLTLHIILSVLRFPLRLLFFYWYYIYFIYIITTLFTFIADHGCRAVSKVWVCGLWLTGIVGTHHLRGMDVCLLWVQCVVR